MKLTLILCLLTATLCCQAQKTTVVPVLTKAMIGNAKTARSTRDTTLEADTSKENKEPRYFYLTLSTNAYVNTTGNFAKRFSPVIEFGRTYGIFDIGLATGRLNSLNAGSDTTQYLEFRPTINVFSKGRFSEALCLGAGYVINAKQGLMTEICNTINFNVSETVAIAVAQGYCFFDGTNNNRSAQYMGFNITYNFLKAHSVNKQRKKAAIVSDN